MVAWPPQGHSEAPRPLPGQRPLFPQKSYWARSCKHHGGRRSIPRPRAGAAIACEEGVPVITGVEGVKGEARPSQRGARGLAWTLGSLLRGWRLDLPSGKHRNSVVGTHWAPHSSTRAPPAPALCSLESLVSFGHPSPSWGGEICCSKDLKHFRSLLLRSRQCSPMPQGDVYGVCGDLVQGGVPPGTPMQGCPSHCWGPHGCCWYWPSVAVKKSSSTLFM